MIKSRICKLCNKETREGYVINIKNTHTFCCELCTPTFFKIITEGVQFKSDYHKGISYRKFLESKCTSVDYH